MQNKLLVIMCNSCSSQMIMFIKKGDQHENYTILYNIENYTTLFCNTIAFHWFRIEN